MMIAIPSIEKHLVKRYGKEEVRETNKGYGNPKVL
jgi:hypothetical protein